jgi:serine O-acetyltransferase
MILDISFTGAAIVYAIPLLALLLLWLLTSLIIYLGIVSPLEFDFKGDILRKFEDKSALPSGPPRLSFLYVAQLLLGDNCVQATFLYRVSHFFARRKLARVALAIHAFSRFATHADISPWAQIGPGFYLYHGMGTVIGKGVRAGSRVLICQGVSVGGAEIGDDVSLWAGAQVIGHVAIGDRSEVGANAVVINDVPADSIVFGIPARLAGKKTPAQSLDSAGTGRLPTADVQEARE